MLQSAHNRGDLRLKYQPPTQLQIASNWGIATIDAKRGHVNPQSLPN
ncbi:hypothetical protein AM1_C0026 (plasmid) [Acaryochloris marina MBIC11017]|uniref:Uncharacterized protein n=1 Tax=Acaryochloris marina (strain MBIC 11017) TaxID=329726 RepID=A8ZMC5_ACAM1|nr:hypothetical protein AM1_C0026 [Acaryochloris marina MBIC11017]